MEYTKKIEEYKVSIRRRHVNEKLANLRVKHQSASPETGNISEILAQIKSLFDNATIEQLYAKVDELKKYSQVPAIVNALKDYF